MSAEGIVENRFKFKVIKANGEYSRIEIFYHDKKIAYSPYGRYNTFNDCLRTLAGSRLKHIHNSEWNFAGSLTGALTPIVAYSELSNPSMHIQYYKKLKQVMEHFDIKNSEYEIYIKTLKMGILFYKFQNSKKNINQNGVLFIDNGPVTVGKLSSSLVYISQDPVVDMFKPFVVNHYLSIEEYDISIKTSSGTDIGIIKCKGEKIKEKVLEELSEHTEKLFRFFNVTPYTEEVIEF